MEILISISIAIYVMQLVVFAVTILADTQCSLPKDISTKKQALAYIIPFGFLYAFYNYYKKLD